MSRRHSAEKRQVLPDPKFGEVVLSRFINCVMKHGKRSVAEGVVYGMLDIIRNKTKGNPIETFLMAVDKVGPHTEVRSRRVGGATYQVPCEVRPDRRQALALRWLRDAARNRSENTMEEKLAYEFMAASNDNGAAIKKRDDTIRMAEANRAFSHYRW